MAACLRSRFLAMSRSSPPSSASTSLNAAAMARCSVLVGGNPIWNERRVAIGISWSADPFMDCSSRFRVTGHERAWRQYGPLNSGRIASRATPLVRFASVSSSSISPTSPTFPRRGMTRSPAFKAVRLYESLICFDVEIRSVLLMRPSSMSTTRRHGMPLGIFGPVWTMP